MCKIELRANEAWDKNNRATFHFGTTTLATLYEAASSSN